MSNLPEKTIIPSDRIPKPFSQNVYKNGRLYTTVNSCVTCSIVKVIETLYAIKNGYYTELSKGYAYVKHSGKSDSGTAPEIVLKSMLEKKMGSVPYDMCTDYTEKPEICKIIENRRDLTELDKEAKNWSIGGWECIKGNSNRDLKANIIKYIETYNVPLVGTLLRNGGLNHCVVITGCDDEYIYYHDHDKSGDECRAKYSKWKKSFYYITIPEGGAEAEPIPEEPTEETKSTTNEVQEENAMGFKLIDVKDFKSYLDGLNITRKINVVQLHHTYSPAYKEFNGANHIKLQEGMKSYHIKEKNYDDIAQTFTIFPDGKICTGRDINVAPAGIYGANSNGICIECVGNFDKNGDTMTEAQKNAIVGVTKILLDKFGLNAKTGVTYHAWWTSGGTNLGTYIAGRSAKTCPGTNFFGGNTRAAYEKNLMPLIENYGKENTTPMIETPNDITWELNHSHFPIDDDVSFVKALEIAKNDPVLDSLYWGYYKLVNRIK